jgi:hypothetical protein
MQLGSRTWDPETGEWTDHSGNASAHASTNATASGTHGSLHTQEDGQLHQAEDPAADAAQAA